MVIKITGLKDTENQEWSIVQKDDKSIVNDAGQVGAAPEVAALGNLQNPPIDLSDLISLASTSGALPSVLANGPVAVSMTDGKAGQSGGLSPDNILSMTLEDFLADVGFLVINSP